MRRWCCSVRCSCATHDTAMRSCAVTQPDTRAISRAGSLAARRRCGGVQRGEEHCAAQLSRGIFFLQFTDSGYGQALAQPFTDCECRRKTHGTERKRNDDASGDLWDFSQWRGGSWLGAGYGIAEACAHDAVQDASERKQKRPRRRRSPESTLLPSLCWQESRASSHYRSSQPWRSLLRGTCSGGHSGPCVSFRADLFATSHTLTSLP